MFRFRDSVIQSESQCVSMALSSGLGMVQNYTIFTIRNNSQKKKIRYFLPVILTFFMPMRKCRDIG